MIRKVNYSFEQWCLDFKRCDLLDKWDYDKNEFSPSEITYKSEKKIWFKCPENRHESEIHRIDNLANGRNKTLYCTKCRSFAQHVIDDYGKEYFEKVWSERNTISPWELTYGNSANVYLNCLDNPEHTYKRTARLFINGITSCPICEKERLIEETSLGSLYPKSLDVWSDKNKGTPYDYSSCAAGSFWWKCDNNIHDDYKKSIASVKRNEFKCPSCNAKVQGSLSHNIIDITGQTFGELTVVGYHTDKEINMINNDTDAYWDCICSCGNLLVVNGHHLRIGHVVSCGDKSVHKSGENHPNWKGGITPERIKQRMSSEYKEWRSAVYAKDWYTCQCCGIKSNGILNAHHIKDFATYEELRYDIDNGITLCINCHDVKETGSLHNTYGTQGVTPEQLVEYINDKRKQLGIPIPFNIDEYRKGNILKPDAIEIIKAFMDEWRFIPYTNLKYVFGEKRKKKKTDFVKIKSRFHVKEE